MFCLNLTLDTIKSFVFELCELHCLGQYEYTMLCTSVRTLYNEHINMQILTFRSRAHKRESQHVSSHLANSIYFRFACRSYLSCCLSLADPVRAQCTLQIASIRWANVGMGWSCMQHVVVGVLTLAKRRTNTKVWTVEVLLLAQLCYFNYAPTVDFLNKCWPNTCLSTVAVISFLTSHLFWPCKIIHFSF